MTKSLSPGFAYQLVPVGRSNDDDDDDDAVKSQLIKWTLKVLLQSTVFCSSF